MTPDPVPAGIPLTSGAGAPEPWNINDVYIWTDAILKYVCIEVPDRNPLHASEFALSETAQSLRNSYHDEEEKERAIDDRNSSYYVLLETCLQYLHELGVLTVRQIVGLVRYHNIQGILSNQSASKQSMSINSTRTREAARCSIVF